MRSDLQKKKKKKSRSNIHFKSIIFMENNKYSQLLC